MGIAEIFHELRKSSGLSQAALARAAGAHPSNLSRWERGETMPTLHELNKVLDALGVTQEERLVALSALEGAEARQAVRAIVPADIPDAMGELWRTLRLRAGLSLTELSAALGVNVSTVSRWERGLTTPGPALMVQALRILAAHPLEQAALNGTRYSLRRPDAARLDWDDYREEIGGTLFYEALYAHPANIELTLLSRMEELAGRAASEARFLTHLAEVCNLMGARLFELGLKKECTRWCDRGLSLLKPTPETKLARAGLTFRKGYCLGRGGQMALLESIESAFNDSRFADLRSQVYREMASAAIALGQLHRAEHFALSAREAAEESGKANYVAASEVVWGRALRANGRAEEAIAYLPPFFEAAHEALEPAMAAQRRLEWAKTLVACREAGAAHDQLNHFFRIAQTYNVISLQDEGERLARMVSSMD